MKQTNKWSTVTKGQTFRHPLRCLSREYDKMTGSKVWRESMIGDIS